MSYKEGRYLNFTGGNTHTYKIKLLWFKHRKQHGSIKQQSSCQLQVLGTHPHVQGAKGWRMSCIWCKQGPGVQWQPWVPSEEAPPVPPWGACTLLEALVVQRQCKLTARGKSFSTPNHQHWVLCKTAEPHTHQRCPASQHQAP